jgi:hypothetical protein
MVARRYVEGRMDIIKYRVDAMQKAAEACRMYAPRHAAGSMKA